MTKHFVVHHPARGFLTRNLKLKYGIEKTDPIVLKIFDFASAQIEANKWPGAAVQSVERNETVIFHQGLKK